jgi:ferredoxin
LFTAREFGMKVLHDPEACVACGLCTDVCPSLFRLEGMEVVASEGEVRVEDSDAVREAAAGCPCEAIAILE